MKICFFTENFLKGGLDTFLINLFNAWPDSGDELSLVCNASHPGLETISSRFHAKHNVTTYNYLFNEILLSAISSDKTIPKIFSKVIYLIIKYPILVPLYLLRLMRFFKHNNFEKLVVVSGGYPSEILCRCAAIAWKLSGMKCDVIYNFHNSAIPSKWYTKYFEYMFDSAVISACSYFVSVSNYCLNTLHNRDAFVEYKNLRYIYNGIEDPLDGRVLKLNSPISPENKSGYCLMLSTYEERKGHEYLLEAFKKVVEDIPSAELNIYGYGDPIYKCKVINKAKELALSKNVNIYDFSKDVKKLLKNAKILVVPSQSYESFGLVIIEAMAFSIPLVITDVGGMPEVIGNSNSGYICNKNDSSSFAEAIKFILSNPSKAKILGENGRRTFLNKFTADSMAKKYWLILQE